MPLDIGGGPTTLQPQPRRRKPRDIRAEASADFNQKLAAAQAASQNSLSSDVVYGLALAGDHDREVARATAILARNGDLLFPKTNTLMIPDPTTGELTKVTPRDVIDPNTREPVDLRRMRAWFRAANLTQAIAPILEDLQNNGVRSRALAGRRDPDTGKIAFIHQKVDPASVASYVSAMDVLPGRIPYKTALNAAVTLAVQNVDRARFTQALGVLVEWNGQTATLDEAHLIGMAQWWAQNRENPMHLADVGPLYDPAVARALEVPKAGPSRLGRPTGPQVVAQQIRTAADAAARSAAGYERYDDLIHQSLEGVLSVEPSFLERAVGGTFDWINTQLLGRIGGAAWYASSFASFGIDEEDQARMREQGFDMLLHGSDPESHETFGDYYAQSVGADPGSTGYQIIAAGSEFALYWFTDPFIVAGKFARGWQMGRLALTGTERELEAAGAIAGFAYGVRTRGKDIATRIEEWLTTNARSSWVKGLMGREASMSNSEWLLRASLKNPEAAARISRGAMSSPGIDPRVTSFIRDWANLRYAGKITDEAIEDTADIFRVAIGARPASEAGVRFHEALESSGLKAVQSRVNGVIRKNVGRTLAESDDNLTPLIRKRIEVAVNRELMEVGLNKRVIKPILDNLRHSTDDELRLLATASRREMQKFLGVGEEAFRGNITDAQVLQASDKMRAHVRDLAERRASLEEFVRQEMDRAVAQGYARPGEPALDLALRRLTGKKDFREIVQPMLDEGAEVSDILDVLVQHQREGGILADLVSPQGLTGGKGTLVAAMEEVRAVLGDDVAELMMAGVQTQAQLRTRLRQMLAGPGSAAYGDLRSGALQLGVPTWADQLGLLEGVQRVFPSRGGFLQHAHEAQLRIADSRYWQSRATEWMRSISEKNPPTLLNIEAFNGAESFGRWLRDMRVPGAEVDSAVAELRRLVTSRGGLREKALSTYMKRWIERGYKAMGVPEEDVAMIMNRVRPHYDYISKLINNRGKLAAGTGMEAMAEPPLETLLKNIFTLPSPKEMEISMRRAFGRFHGVDRRAREMFGKAVEDLSHDEWGALVDNISRTRVLYARGLERGAIWADHARNTWVAWQLLRPGWALKVLPDENFRALVMLQDLFDRVSAVRTYARVFDKLGIRGRQFGVRLVDGSEEIIELRLPGLLAHEPSAAQGLMHGTMLKSTAWKQAQLAKSLEATLKPLEAGSKDYFQIWAHLLDRRVMGSELGTWVMKALVHDSSDGAVWTWGRVMDNARANPRIWQALRQPGEELEDVVQRAWTYVTQAVSTKGQINDDLIRLALRGEVTPHTLKKTIGDLKVGNRDLPTLPMLETEEAVAVRAPLLAGYRDKLTDVLMRRPSDNLNRNPLYKALYQRELERLIKVETAAGRTFTRSELALIQNGEHPLALTARNYALNRELGAMFTYINNSRFSEAARHIFPFFSPYQEQYTVWGRLLWQSPHVAEETRLMLKLATDTGVIYKDEGTGEWVVNSKVLAAGLTVGLLFSPASLYALAEVGVATGLARAAGLPSSDWVTPVSNLNLFLANTLTVGGVPIPTPGLSPPMEFFANKAAEHTGDFPFKANLVNYFSAYGSDLSVLPASWHKVLTAVFPKFDQDLYENTKNHMVDSLILQGFELVDERGREIPGAAEELDRISGRMATEWLLLRALNQFTQPTAPVMTTEADEVRDEFFDLIEENGYRKAAKMMQERYPDAPNITMLGIGYSLWNQEGPSIPPTLEASAILSAPGFEQAAKEYPELALFLIPSEFRDGTYDFDEARKQLDEGLRAVSPAIVMQGDRITGGRANEYLRQQGWEEFYTIESTFKAKLKAAGSPVEGTQAYDAIRERWRDRPIDELQQRNLTWGNDYVLHEEPFLDDTLNKLREVSTLPIWRDTEMGKALADYFAVADPLRERMYNNNITALDTASAQELGLDEDYKALVDTMKTRYGDTWDLLERYWLGDDFKTLPTYRDDVLKHVGADEKWVADVLVPWEKKWRAASRAITNADTQTEESAAFVELNRLSLQSQRLEGPAGVHPQELWWETQTRHEQMDTRMRVAQKPYVFMTTFERRNILGIKSSDAVEKAFITIAEAKVTVNRAIDNGVDASTAWGQFDKWVKEEIYPVPGMRKAIKQAHGFGYALFKNIPKAWKNGTEGEAWAAIQEGANNIHQAFRNAEFVDDEEFRKVKVAFGEYISLWEDYSPDFKDHVNYLREISGDQLNEVLLPELWWILI